jgi:hypothetical protein
MVTMRDESPEIGGRASDWQVRASELRILDELAYVIESVAQTYTGEAKTELGRLIGWMESDLTVATSFAPELKNLTEAMSLFRQNSYLQATGLLAGVNRTLWYRIRGK